MKLPFIYCKLSYALRAHGDCWYTPVAIDSPGYSRLRRAPGGVLPIGELVIALLPPGAFARWQSPIRRASPFMVLLGTWLCASCRRGRHYPLGSPTPRLP